MYKTVLYNTFLYSVAQNITVEYTIDVFKLVEMSKVNKSVIINQHCIVCIDVLLYSSKYSTVLFNIVLSYPKMYFILI